MIEIHGLTQCPFAWRVRLAAREKDVPFDWIPYDAERPDPRAEQHNPEHKSPKLWQDGYGLIESAIIAQYLDESQPGRPLEPKDPRERAAMRLRIEQIAKKLEGHPKKVDDALRERVRKGYDELAKALGDRPWLGGNEPDLSDLMVWPFLHLMDEAGVHPTGAVSEYLEHVRAHPSFRSTRPT